MLRRALFPIALATLAAMLFANVSGGPVGTAVPAPAAAGSEADVNCNLATFGAHSYRVCEVGHPAETALAAHPNGKVFAADERSFKVTTNGGQRWDSIGAFLPPNIVAGVYPEGDVVVAQNGDILTNWLSVDKPHTSAIWTSRDGGASWQFKALEGPQPVPDRPWIMTTAQTPADSTNPLQPKDYIALTKAGVGAKLHWFSVDRGETWLLPPTSQVMPSQLMVNGPFPALPANPYMDYNKPFGQGFEANKWLALPGGQLVDLQLRRFTTDFVHWTTFETTGWPNFPYWDVSSDGTIYNVAVQQRNGVWQISYKYYDGTSWQTGAASPTLTAKPDYLIGLSPTHVVLAAVKSHGSLLGINTREGNQDVLIRIQNANTANPTWTKERVGPGCPDRYDFPNLVFDNVGRAVASYCSSFVAYAQSV